jgi:hypothetical protein
VARIHASVLCSASCFIFRSESACANIPIFHAGRAIPRPKGEAPAHDRSQQAASGRGYDFLAVTRTQHERRRSVAVQTQRATAEPDGGPQS